MSVLPKFMRHFPIAIFATLTMGCAIWSPGTDPRGRATKQELAPVVSAIKAFKKDTGGYPKVVEDLIPRYLSHRPSIDIRFYSDSGGSDCSVSFAYSPTWPQAGRVRCSFKLSEGTWNCVGQI